VHPAGGNADLGAHAELAAVGELGRGVVEHDGAVDLGEEPVGGGLVAGDNSVGVVRAVTRDMGDSRVEAVDNFHRDDCVEIFPRPVGFGRRAYSGNQFTGRRVTSHGAARLLQGFD